MEKFNITKEELYTKYIIEKKTVKELMIEYNCGRKAIVSRLEKYNIKKQTTTLNVVNKDTLYKLYITENKTAEEIGIIYGTHRQQVMKKLKSLGIIKDNDKIQESKFDTFYKKTGYKTPMSCPAIAEKQKQSLINKYGVDNPMKSKVIREKVKQTNIEKYGVENPAQNEEFKKKYIDSIHKTMIEKYGVDWACQLENCYNAIGAKSSNTKPNLAFSELLNNNSIVYEKEYHIGHLSYDFKIDNILVEINPTATHNSTWSPFTKDHHGLAKDYHKNKTDNAKSFGFKCVHIFDWEAPEKILYLFNKEKIYARKCEIKLVEKDDAKKFIDRYHFQNYAKSKINIGLYYKNELVSIMTFGKPRYNNSYEYELIRYCNSKNVIGGSEKLFNYFLEKYKPNSIISYCDNSKFTGDVYKKLNFKYIRCKNVSKHWYNIKTKQHITDNLLRQRGFDQLFGTNYGKGTSNEELMLNAGFVEVYDCGQDIWTYKKTEN